MRQISSSTGRQTHKKIQHNTGKNSDTTNKSCCGRSSAQEELQNEVTFEFILCYIFCLGAKLKKNGWGKGREEL